MNPEIRCYAACRKVDGQDKITVEQAMTQEIEIKLKYRDRDEILDTLKNLGAEPKGKHELRDLYFSQHRTMSYEYALIRIREKGEVCELTYKGKCEIREHVWERTELTSLIDDPEVMSEILHQIGWIKIRENVSLREVFNLNDVEIALIDFVRPHELSLIELEGAEARINQLLGELDCSVEPVGEQVFEGFDKIDLIEGKARITTA